MSDNGENWDDSEWVLSKLADEQLTRLRRVRVRNYFDKLEGILRKVSESLRGDRVFLLKVVEEHGWALKYASPELQKDREVVLQAVKNEGFALKHASAELKDDEEVVLQAAKNNGYALQFSSPKLQKDRKFVLQVVKNKGEALEYASPELKKDRKLVLEAVKNYGYALCHASAKLKENLEVVLQAVRNDGRALYYASAKLKKDRVVALQAVKNDGRALEFASDELKRDFEIAVAAAAQTESALQFVPENIKPDVEARLVPMKRQPRPRKVLADRPVGEDHLDLQLMAYAIADILVSKNLSTPFVTGIFGDWGSGKSFLIHLIEQRLGEIMSHDLSKPEFQDIEDYPFCGHIYTVHFNAWTYSKEELWASLMYRILYDLNEQLDLEAHIRSLPGDFCRRGIDYIDLKEQLRSKEMKEAFKKYTTKELAGLSYEPKRDGKASKELIRVLNKAYRGEVEELPRKIRELEELNARINRKHWKSSIWKTTEEHFRSELKNFRESNPSDESIADMLKSVGILKRWSKLLLGGINQSPFSLFLIMLMVACAIAVTVIVLTDNMGKMEEYVNAFYSGIGAFLSLGIGTVVNTIRKAQKALDDLGVTGAIVSADAAVEKFEDSLAAMEEGEPRESDLAQRHRLECEISAMKNRRWLVEGDSLHDQVRNRLNLSNYEDRLGIAHQAQEDLEMLSRAMELAYTHGNSGEELKEKTPDISDQEEKPVNLEPESLRSKDARLCSCHGAWSCFLLFLRSILPLDGFFGCFNIWRFAIPQLVSRMRTTCRESFTNMIGRLFKAVSSMKAKMTSSRFCEVMKWGFVSDSDFKDRLRRDFGTQFEEHAVKRFDLLEERKDEPRFPRGKPRIVLFIDDLDRCPPEKVVDVIEALQLLLDRTDVFVAILALDVRYVTRALEKQYKDILIKDSEPSGFQYLQKIIQLPFSVPRMSPSAIKNYFEHQLSRKGRKKENSKKSWQENSSDATKSDEEKEPEVPNSDMVIEEGGSTSNAIIHFPFSVPRMSPTAIKNYFEHIQYPQKIIQRLFYHPRMFLNAISNYKFDVEEQEFVDEENNSLSVEQQATVNIQANEEQEISDEENDTLSVERTDLDYFFANEEQEFSDEEDNTSSKEQQEPDYIFANEEQEFSDEEVEMITVAGQAARINPRSGRMIANVFKVLKNIWARKNEEPESSVKQALMHLLSYAASNQLLMGRVLANLEDELISAPDVGEKTLHQFWMDQLRNCPSNHRPNHHNHRLFGKTSETWGNVKLEKIGYEDVRLMRSFSFVGYLTSVEDDESKEEQQQ